jgi:hypothetical protein
VHIIGHWLALPEQSRFPCSDPLKGAAWKEFGTCNGLRTAALTSQKDYLFG